VLRFEPLKSPERDEFSSIDFFSTIKFFLLTAELLKLPNFTHLKYMQGVLIQYLFDYLLSSYKEWNPQLNQKVILQLKKYRTHCQQFNENSSLLHLAVRRFSYPPRPFFDNSPSYFPLCFDWDESPKQTKILRLILETGIDPNATDDSGRIPLHFVAENFMDYGHFCRKSYWMFFQTLVDAGSHIYLANSIGETVFDVLRRRLFRRCGSPYYIDLDSIPVPPLRLSQLCAQVIRFHQIPFDDQLPPSLLVFVRHGSTFLGKFPFIFLI
jgi:hypothetical protein